MQLTTVEAAHCYWKSFVQLYVAELQSNSKLLLIWTAISVNVWETTIWVKWEKGVSRLINETSTVLQDNLESYATQCVEILEYIILYLYFFSIIGLLHSM